MIRIIPLILILSLLNACKSKNNIQSNSSTVVATNEILVPEKNDRQVLWLPANPETLNPILASDAYSRAVHGSIFDSLVRYNPKTGDPEGALAESWKISEDGLTYSFTLRKNALFHDGKPVTAEDVKFSFDTIKNPKVDAAHIQNYFQPLESVQVKGPYEVEFKLREKYFRNLIMIGLTDILPRHIYGVGDFNTNPANRAPIGSGPYRFVKWDNGRSIELKRFKDYWGTNDPIYKNLNNFNEILFRIILDDRVAVMATKKKEIDAIDPTPTMWLNDFADAETDKNFYKMNYSTPDGNGYRFIGWNLLSPLFNSKNTRLALTYALNRDAINQKIFKGILQPAVGPFPLGSEKSDPNLKAYPYDLEKAKSLLAAEGWKDTNGDGIADKGGKDFRFELLFTASPEVERFALIYQKSLKEIGIEMNLRSLEWTVFLKQMEEKKFDAVMLAWGAALDSDPYQIWHSSQAKKGGSNIISYNNSRVDEILTTARKTLDKEERNKLYQEFSRIIYDEVPYLFIFERPMLSLADRRFKNVLPLGKLGSDSAAWFTPKGSERYQASAE